MRRSVRHFQIWNRACGGRKESAGFYNLHSYRCQTNNCLMRSLNVKRIILLSLIIVLLLTGCGIEIQNTSEHNSTTEYSVNLIGDLPVSEQDEEQNVIVDVTNRLILNDKHLLDVSIVNQDCFYALYIDTEMSETKDHCSIVQTKSGDFDTEVIGEFDWKRGNQRKKTDILPNLTFLSLQPLIILDNTSWFLYFPEENISISVGALLDVKDIICLDGRIFALAVSGSLYELEMDGSLNSIWERPEVVSKVDLAASEYSKEVTLKLEGTYITGGDVYLSIDPFSEKQKYYRLPNGTRRMKYCDSNISFYLESGYYKKIIFSDRQQKKKSELDITDEYIAHDDVLICSAFPWADGFFCFYAKGKNGEVTKVAVARYDRLSLQDEIIPEMEEYSLPDFSQEHLEERIKKIEEKYGVRVHFNGSYPKTVGGREIQQPENMPEVSKALDVLDETFEMYPNDFFFDLIKGWVKAFDIYLTGTLKTDYSNPFLDYEEGICAMGTDGVEIAIIYNRMDKRILIHEISHAVDQRIYRTTSKFDKEWKAFNPEGFVYGVEDSSAMQSGRIGNEYTSKTYRAKNEKDYSDVYFVDSYGKSSTSEDRARLWEHLMGEDKIPDFYKSVHIQEKLKYYFSEIRNCMDTSKWPDETEWERRLREIF